MIPTTNLQKIITELEPKEPWNPVKIANANNQNVWFAKFNGEYGWHHHTTGDEIFYVYAGEITIQIKDNENLILKQGDWATIPAGLIHCPKSDIDSYVIMIEPENMDTIKE